jgi:hypothetical protein
MVLDGFYQGKTKPIVSFGVLRSAYSYGVLTGCEMEFLSMVQEIAVALRASQRRSHLCSFVALWL